MIFNLYGFLATMYTEAMREARHGDMPEAVIDGFDELCCAVILDDNEQLALEGIRRYLDELIEENEGGIAEITFMHPQDVEQYCDFLWRKDFLEAMPIAQDMADLDRLLAGLKDLFSEQLTRWHPASKIIWWSQHLDERYPRIIEAEGNRVIKLPPDFFGRLEAESSLTKYHRYEALKMLYSAPWRSPYIAYNIISYDPDLEPRHGHQVQRFIPVRTLDSLLAAEDKPPFMTTLRYFYESLEGLQFLLDIGLTLADLSDSNLGINTETDMAVWFDFDGLRCADVMVNGFIGREDYIPPERGKDGDNEIPITESEMIYECGVTFLHILMAYPDRIRSFYALLQQMLHKRPQRRPTIAQVQNWLDEEFTTMGLELPDARLVRRP